jgi:hypothetical protein
VAQREHRIRVLWATCRALRDLERDAVGRPRLRDRAGELDHAIERNVRDHPVATGKHEVTGCLEVPLAQLVRIRERGYSSVLDDRIPVDDVVARVIERRGPEVEPIPGMDRDGGDILWGLRCRVAGRDGRGPQLGIIELDRDADAVALRATGMQARRAGDLDRPVIRREPAPDRVDQRKPLRVLCGVRAEVWHDAVRVDRTHHDRQRRRAAVVRHEGWAGCRTRVEKHRARRDEVDQAVAVDVGEVAVLMGERLRDVEHHARGTRVGLESEGKHR